MENLIQLLIAGAVIYLIWQRFNKNGAQQRSSEERVFSHDEYRCIEQGEPFTPVYWSGPFGKDDRGLIDVDGYSGIYVWCRGSKVIYVGQASNLGDRPHKHWTTSHGERFEKAGVDTLYLGVVPGTEGTAKFRQQRLDAVERTAIVDLKPAINRSHQGSTEISCRDLETVHIQHYDEVPPGLPVVQSVEVGEQYMRESIAGGSKTP
jgi:hypothetical protein